MNTIPLRLAAAIMLAPLMATLSPCAHAAPVEGTPCRELGEREGAFFCSGGFAWKSDARARPVRIDIDFSRQGMPAGRAVLSLHEGQAARIDANASSPRLPAGFSLSLVPIEGPDGQYALAEASLPGEPTLRETMAFPGSGSVSMTIGSVGITARFAPR
jgi:hypothetical protein